jgi:hypothetical protein
MLGVLLEALSSLEPAKLNYMQFHTESMGITQTQLEAARVAAVSETPIAKASPPPPLPIASLCEALVAQAIQRCLLQVDASNVAEVVDRIKSLFRHGVGLQTKGPLDLPMCSTSPSPSSSRRSQVRGSPGSALPAGGVPTCGPPP